jgi:glucosamine-6-phosphate deaminase
MKVPKMDVRVLPDRESLGRAAAERAASSLRSALHDQGSARLVAATGASQFEFLDALTMAPGIDWARVEMFHLDEYIGLPISHRASFRRYLFERLIYKTGITRYHLLDAEGDFQEVVRRVGQELKSKPVDLSFVGIGENAHLAFNDPPADFESDEPYLVVDLDEACRRQQVGEGWFADLSEVPRRAISMSVRQILKAKEIIAVVPDARKAQAVKISCEGDVTPLVPASILRTHPKTTVFLDQYSACLLSAETKALTEPSRS